MLGELQKVMHVYYIYIICSSELDIQLTSMPTMLYKLLGYQDGHEDDWLTSGQTQPDR